MENKRKRKIEELLQDKTIEETSEMDDQVNSMNSNTNISSYITTPYERVLSIIKEAKAYIKSITNEQEALLKKLEWTIKVIASHNLYSYELKDKDIEDSKDNPELKQFVNFVNSYKEDLIQTKEKKNPNFGKKLLKSSLKLKRERLVNYESTENEEKKEFNTNEKEITITVSKEKNNENNNINNKIIKGKTLKNLKRDELKKKEKYSSRNIGLGIKLTPNLSASKNKKNSLFSLFKKKKIEALSPKPKNIKKKGELSGKKKMIKSFSGNLDIENLFKGKFSSNILENALININYSPNKILDKSFNIFELKEIIGHDNVLPLMGKIILDSFGLFTDEIISTEKLDPFLVSVSNQYFKTTLYHNSMHGADVTQSLCLYFLNSNAEEICQSLILDLLGIFISALGHDLGHPGFTNIFHINSSSELAITYNDISVLENFHTSKLFRIIRNPETDIFEKLSVQDYKTIRKRMVGNILATDMANHGKIMTVINSRISINREENRPKFEILSGNDKTKFEEQQGLFDFLIHAADLAHNTKLFNISIRWVELLTEEFWRQGDKEKSLNLPVSFLCDREKYNIPQSQVGFLKGFIIPTFESLINIFPSLKWTVVNAKTNLDKWQNLVNKGRLRGWTPEKAKKINMKEKAILFSSITNYKEHSKLIKRKSGNINSLSYEFQFTENKTQTEKEKQNNNLKKNLKSKIIKPIFITKTKNHDKKNHVFKK